MLVYRFFRCPIWISIQLILFIITSGCAPGGSPVPEEAHHDHDEEDGNVVVVTTHAQGYEVFAEYPVAVVGQPVPWIIHVTDLISGKPRTEGPIEVVLKNNQNEGWTYTRNTPDRPGIYLLSVSFPEPGEWDVYVQIPTPDFTASIFLSKVVVSETPEVADRVVATPATEGIVFLKEQQWNHPIRIQPAHSRRLVRHVTVPARVQSKPGYQSTVVAPVAGRILAEGTWPTRGQQVKAGQVLVRIQPVYSDIATQLSEIQTAIQSADIEVADAKQTFDRIEKLAAVEAKSQRELQVAERELRLAEARLEGARSRQSSFFLTYKEMDSSSMDTIPSLSVLSSMDGIIESVQPIANGDYVRAATSLLTLLNTEVIHINGYVPESMGSSVMQIKGADVERVAVNEEWIPVLGADKGQLLAVGQVVDPMTRTLDIVIEVENKMGLFRIGENLLLHLHAEEVEDALAIPVSALIEEEGLQTVYVQTGGETFQKRVVKTGVRDRSWVQVLEGIDSGEWVVFENAYAIRLASLSEEGLPHGHHH